MRTTVSRILRWLSWHRRPVAAACAALAVLSITAALRPPTPPQTAVVLLAAERAGGHQLTATDLRVAAWPIGLAPDGAVAEPAELVGRTLTAPMSAGSPVTELSVLSELSAAASPGMVIAPVRLADAELVSLLRAGERIDLIGLDPAGGSTVIARSARLVSIPTAPASSGGLGPSTQSTSIILVEVDEKTSLALVAAAAAGPLSAVLR